MFIGVEIPQGHLVVKIKLPKLFGFVFSLTRNGYFLIGHLWPPTILVVRPSVLLVPFFIGFPDKVVFAVGVAGLEGIFKNMSERSSRTPVCLTIIVNCKRQFAIYVKDHSMH